MMEPDELVRSRMQELDLPVPDVESAMGAAKRRGPIRRTGRRRGQAVAAMVAVAVLLVVMLAVGVTRRSDGSAPVVSAGDPAAPAAPWQMLPALPGPTRGTLNAMMAGADVLVWGASVGATSATTAAGGYELDPDTDRWRSIPEPGIDRPVLRRVLAWTGTRVLLLGCATGTPALPVQALSYDPGTRVWAALPAPPLAGSCDPYGVWSGAELLVWQNQQGAAYDPIANSWRTVSAPPGTGRDAALMGPKVLVTSTESLPRTNNEQRRVAWVFDLQTETWAPAAPPPVWGPNAWVGDRLLVLGASSGTLFAYDPSTDAWTRRADVPLAPREGVASAVVDGRFVAWGGIAASKQEPRAPLSTDPEVLGDATFSDGAIYDIAADRWSALPPSPLSPRSGAAGLTVGGEVLIIGGADPCVQYLSDGARLRAGGSSDRTMAATSNPPTTATRASCAPPEPPPGVTVPVGPPATSPTGTPVR